MYTSKIKKTREHNLRQKKKSNKAALNLILAPSSESFFLEEIPFGTRINPVLVLVFRRKKINKLNQEVNVTLNKMKRMN